MAEPETKVSPKQPIESAIRVFISSTFRDMRQEREELVKQVFPELRRLCDSRAVVWSEVDLRWGVNDEQKAEGMVLPICLAEIQNCRPYFVGIIGERYGWVPEQIDPDLMQAQPWLREHLKKSVTELEILHGVLNDPAMAEHALFYFRDPAYARGKPAEDFSEPSAERRRQLEDLKERIRQAHREGKLKYAPRENYGDPKALAELVRKDLSEVIERLFPADATPDALSREIVEQEAAGKSRLRVYVAREEYYRRLDEHVAGDGPPLVVLGESGAGKTALLANWVARWRELKHDGPQPLLIQHYIGATPSSTHWVAMVRRVLRELDRHFELKLEIPDKPEALRMAFANGLFRAAARGRVVLVLDALNQLEDRDQAPELPWLPPEVPPNVRLIVSTLPGRALDELGRRQWPTMTVGLLSVEERRELIPSHLKQYGKTLADDQVDRLASAAQTQNPLFLRTLLEELRVWGEYETLNQRIDDHLEAESIPALFEKVFLRWQRDYGGDTDLVGDVLSLLVCARRGLSVHELLQILGSEDQPLPRAVLAPLLYAAGDVLVDRSGLLNLSHDFARQAALDTYLPADNTRRQFHLRLADHFAKQPLGPRKADELPWQLERAGEWQRLYDLLAEEEFFAAAWWVNRYEVMEYWATIESASPLRMVDAYAGVIAGQHGEDIAWSVGLLLGDTGHPSEAMAIRQRLTEQLRTSGDQANLSASLGNQAAILRLWGRLDEAMALRKEQEHICRQLGDLDSLEKSLGGQALILYARGRLDEALALHMEQEHICKQLGNLDGLQRSLGNQALILQDRGKLDEAMALHKEEERICKQLGNLNGLQTSLGNQALILKDQDKLDEAMALLKEQERICKQLGNLDGFQKGLGNQALILQAWGKLTEAMALHKEQECICNQLGNLDDLQASLGEQANILKNSGKLDEAMALHKEQERICKQLGNLDGLQRSLGNQAYILKNSGKLDDAMALLREQERVCQQLGNLDGLQRSLGNQAVIVLGAGGKPDEAMALLKEQERICKQLGNLNSLQGSLGNQALILQAWGKLTEAMALLKEQERICKQLGNLDDLQRSLGNQAAILRAWGKPDEAVALLKEEAAAGQAPAEGPDGRARDALARVAWEAVARLLRLQDSAKAGKAGGLNSREVTDLLRSCCDITRYLAQDGGDLDPWVCLVGVLMNVRRFEEARLAFWSVQRIDPSPDACDSVLGEGSTQSMKENSESAAARAVAFLEEWTRWRPAPVR